MANTESFQLDYKTDFGGLVEKLRFKVERGKMEESGLADLYETPSNERRVTCASARYFAPRKLKLVFFDGFSIELPIRELDLVDTYISQVDYTKVACVSLKGEKWKFVPPGILGGTYTTEGIESPDDKPDSTKFTYRYQLDGAVGGTGIILSTSFENKPDAIFVEQQACLDILEDQDTIKCSGGKGIAPRRFIGERSNLTTGGTIRRQIIVSSADESTIKQCGQNGMSTFNCFSYVGQTIENVLDYYTV